MGATRPSLISLRPWAWPYPVDEDLVPEGVGPVHLPHTHHIYEETRHTLDLTVDRRLMDAIDLKVSAENLTDSDVEFRLGGETTLLYSPGRSYTVKATYAF